MSYADVIERYVRRFDRAVGAEPAALDELVDTFSENAVVNFDGTPHTGRARLLELFARILGPMVETCTHFTPELLADGTVKVPWAASGRMSDGGVLAIAGTEYYTIDDEGLISKLVNEPCGRPLVPGRDEARSA
jgi:SnoaL-like domain